MMSTRFAPCGAKWERKTVALKRAAVFVCTSLVIFAQSNAHAGLEEGRVKAQACIACHGADGNSSIPIIPNLAGQPRQFIVQSLYMFREGIRKNDMMSPFAAKLSNADLNDLAQFFNSQKPTQSTAKAAPELIAKMQTLTDKNNCTACHTPSLVGQQHIPRLAGQHKDYLLEQLKGFKTSKRADIDGTMTSAAQGLAMEDLEPLAEYLSTLSAP
jgi:cytochrome c553